MVSARFDFCSGENAVAALTVDHIETFSPNIPVRRDLRLRTIGGSSSVDLPELSCVSHPNTILFIITT